tara:strand:- start:1246 stop:1464 length:219 start_codon:yes stop_codon:yes gene_type:complete
MIKKNKIKIKANGRFIYINNKCTVKMLLKKRKIPLNMVAIELNKKILNKSKIDKIFLKNNDKLEIVHFIGGG